jgi:hypothetical protein
MPTNHGLHCKLPPRDQRGKLITREELTKFRYGIHGIFDALKRGPFLRGKPEGMKAAQLEFHFTEVCQRFVFSLQHLNGLLPQLLHAYTGQRPPPPSVSRLQFEAECEADHVLTYLNTLVDDIALVILLATGHPISKDADSMGKLRRDSLRNEPALAPVKPLLLEMDQPNSWWGLAFVQQTGARQLIVHNQHLVKFQTSGSNEQGYLWSLLQSPFSQTNTRCSDFLGLIRATLTSLFDWLDRLEAVLTAHLRTLDSSWSPPAFCHFIPLPVGYPVGTTTYDEAYFPVPLCDGSDPLPWNVTLREEA